MISIPGLTNFGVTCVIAASLTVMPRGDDDAKGYPNLSDLAQKLPKGISLDNLPKDISLDNLPGSLNVSDFPIIDESERKLKEKCMKNGLNTSYDHLLAVKGETQVCLKGLLNPAELKKEIDEGKPTGDLDKVFSKYCRKSPTFKGCILNFTTALEPCLEDSEKELKKTVQNITEALIDFICAKDGDSIALFIAEGGPECITQNEEAIKSCLNSTLMKYTPPDFEEDTKLPLLKLGKQECLDVFEIQDCIVKELETCPDPTTANLAGSLIDFVSRVTPCNGLKPKREKKRPGCNLNLSSSFHILTDFFN